MKSSQPAPFCPSMQSDTAESIVFGVNEATSEEPHIAYLATPQEVTNTLLESIHPVTPTRILRIAAPCAQEACLHFDGKDCRLVQQIVQLLPPVVRALPPCRIRPICRWWQQEGRAACLRCPQIITESHTKSELLQISADTPLGDTQSHP